MNNDVLDVKDTNTDKQTESSVLKADKHRGKIEDNSSNYINSSKIKNNNEKEIKNKERTINKKNRITTGLSIATAILAVSTLGLGVGFAITDSQAMRYKSDLENVYKNNFYSLLDNVNNLETKISKIISASSSTYQRKTLLEASKNASEAEIAVASLPFSQSDIDETVKMVNQISGYTSTLAEKLASGESLTSEELDTLENIDQSVLSLKTQLNEFAKRLQEDYSIIDASMDLDTNSNAFSRALSSLKDNDVEYPTMIYDGPFSDSVVNSAIKGLNGDNITKSEAKENVEKYFKSATNVEYESQTKGRFETYNFRVTSSNDEMLFVQVTKVGGHILTISGAGVDGESSIDMAAAKDIALEFAGENGIENAVVVWSDSIENDVYLNIAPKEQGIILYPDLVKVKVNMVSGTVVGYDATSYFTNHVDRTLSKGELTLSEADNKLPSRITKVQSRYVLSPLDYNREVVCVEVEATEGQNTYYFYYNAQTGDLENVLKVIKTDNGNLLM